MTENETQTQTGATGAPPGRPGADAGDAATAPGTGSPGGPLAGIVVLDLASVGPAARCTRILADYGATVIKVGAVPGRGAEPVIPPFYAYSGSRYLQRTAIDLKEEEGRQAFLALVRTADVVVESFRPGVVDRLGIGFEDLAEVNPSIILCSTTGYGQHGPRSSWAGHDINYLAVGGYLATTEPGGDGGPPVPGATIADAAGGGMQAAMAVMAAIVGRGSGGTGPTHLDVSIADGVLWLTSLAVDEYLATGAPVGYGRNIITGRYACYGTYRTADGGWLAVGAIEPKFYANLCRLLGCQQWSDSQLDDQVQGQDQGGLRRRLRHQGPRHMDGRAGRRRHLRDAGPVGGRAGRRRAVRGAPGHRRRRHRVGVDGWARPVPTGRSGAGRHGGPVGCRGGG